MNVTLPDKESYQKSRRIMCFIALGMMVATTIATLLNPTAMAEAESILMTQYLALSGLVGTYFALGNK